MFEEIFKRKILIPNRLNDYGFVDKNGTKIYKTKIMNDEFLLQVSIEENGAVDTELTEIDSNEPYVLYKTGSSGTFIGEVRAAIEAVLTDIASKCYETKIFKSKQAGIAIQYIREKYGDELEFLWEKFSDNAVWRRKDNKKWYGLILTAAGSKIGITDDNVVEIVDLRMDPAKKDDFLSRDNYYPGWHMNKNSWYTIIFDNGISNEELKERISESYELAASKTRKK